MKMTNYRKVVPIALVIFMGLSAYNGVNTKAKKEKKYQRLLEQARDYSKDKIYKKAEIKYLEAQKLKDSVELRTEIGKMYLTADDTTKARNWSSSFLQSYGKEPESYEYKISFDIDTANYDEMFQIFDKAKAQHISSEYLDKQYKKYKYIFDFGTKSYDYVSEFCLGFSPVRHGETWAYTDTQAKEITEFKYKYAGPFNPDGFAPVIDKDGNAYLIDKDGAREQNFKGIKHAESIGMVVDDVYPVKKNDAWYYYNLDGKKLSGPYQEATTTANGYASVKEDDMWYIIDSSLKKVSQTKYNDIVSDEKGVIYRNGRIFVNDNGHYYMVDNKGKRIGKENFANARTFGDTDGLAAVQINGKWGFVDKNGKLVIKPKYDNARSFVNGYAAVLENGKWGFINDKGNYVIKPQFEGAKDFSSSGTVYVIDKYQNWKLLKLFKDNYDS